MRRATVCLTVFLGLVGSTLAGAGDEPSIDPNSPIEISWETDYCQAFRKAQEEEKMLFVRFFDRGENEPCRRLESKTLADPKVCRKLSEFACVRLPLDAQTLVGGKQVTLLKDRAFAEMLTRPGVAIVDLADPDSPTHGLVISAFPLTEKLSYTPANMLVILDLPAGTLTQRTLIYAVRIHPEKPASTNGTINAYLLEEARRHSDHQARIRLQGHHQWDARFRRITGKLPGELMACEVCAESWPGEPLVEAAIECVRCWRFSSGHWSAVKAYHDVYGYDMKRGSNGIWYATGIFGRG